MFKVPRRRGGEYVEVARAENEGIEHLGDEGDTWGARQPGFQALGARPPSALLLAWMAQIRMSLETVCETSPSTWKTLKPMAGSGARSCGREMRRRARGQRACRRQSWGPREGVWSLSGQRAAGSGQQAGCGLDVGVSTWSEVVRPGVAHGPLAALGLAPLAVSVPSFPLPRLRVPPPFVSPVRRAGRSRDAHRPNASPSKHAFCREAPDAGTRAEATIRGHAGPRGGANTAPCSSLKEPWTLTPLGCLPVTISCGRAAPAMALAGRCGFLDCPQAIGAAGQGHLLHSGSVQPHPRGQSRCGGDESWVLGGSTAKRLPPERCPGHLLRWFTPTAVPMPPAGVVTASAVLLAQTLSSLLHTAESDLNSPISVCTTVSIGAQCCLPHSARRGC